MEDSKRIDSVTKKHASRLVKAFGDWKNLPDSFSKKPEGVFGAVATVICNGVTVNSKELDLEFAVPFDDDLEPNEAEIIIYNLTDDTIKRFSKNKSISIEAGYEGDTGVIFKGYVNRVRTTFDGADKITTIKAFDDIKDHTIESKTFAAGTKASVILRWLIDKTGLPVAVFKPRRDHTYENEQTVDGDIMEAIKKYSQVCGVSTFVLKGKVYSRYIKDGDNINFTVKEETGMLGSPEEYEEEVTAEDYKDIINGYKINMLLQHRMQTAAIMNVESLITKGSYRVRSGEHIFNETEAITKIKVM